MESDRQETGLALRRIRAVETLDQWTDPTPLTLDTLRAELGEPEQSFNGNSYWPGVSYESGGILVGSEVRTLGQLRRLLSVIRETETRSGGDAGV